MARGGARGGCRSGRGGGAAHAESSALLSSSAALMHLGSARVSSESLGGSSAAHDALLAAAAGAASVPATTLARTLTRDGSVELGSAAHEIPDDGNSASYAARTAALDAPGRPGDGAGASDAAEGATGDVSERRRLERNMREHRRCAKISEQIDDLRQLLESGGCLVNKANKSSILDETAKYIRKLQQRTVQLRQRCVQLDLERRRLVTQGEDGATSGTSSEPGQGDGSRSASPASGESAAAAPPARAVKRERSSDDGDDDRADGPAAAAWPSSEHRSAAAWAMEDDDASAEHALAAASARGGAGSGAAGPALVGDLDYKAAFFRDACVPIAVAGMDGGFLESNARFREVSGYSHDELLQLTLFKLTVPWELQQTFTMVSAILRSPEPVPRFTTRALTKYGQQWTDLVVTLIRDAAHQPQYFTLCLIESASGCVGPPAGSQLRCANGVTPSGAEQTAHGWNPHSSLVAQCEAAAKGNAARHDRESRDEVTSTAGSSSSGDTGNTSAISTEETAELLLGLGH